MRRLSKVRAFQTGAVDYITKPFQLEEVLTRMETHLTLYRQRRELEQQRELKARFVSMATHEFRTPLALSSLPRTSCSDIPIDFLPRNVLRNWA